MVGLQKHAVVIPHRSLLDTIAVDNDLFPAVLQKSLETMTRRKLYVIAIIETTYTA